MSETHTARERLLDCRRLEERSFPTIHNESGVQVPVMGHGPSLVEPDVLPDLGVAPGTLPAASGLDVLCERLGLDEHPRVRAAAELFVKLKQLEERLNRTAPKKRHLNGAARLRKRLFALFDEIHGAEDPQPQEQLLLGNLAARDAVFAEAYANWVIDTLTGAAIQYDTALRNVCFYLHVSDQPVALPTLCRVEDRVGLEMALSKRLKVRGARAGIHPVAQVFDTTATTQAPLSHWLASLRTGAAYGERVLRDRPGLNKIPPMQAAPGAQMGTGYLVMGRVRSSALSEGHLDETLFAGKLIAEDITLVPLDPPMEPEQSEAAATEPTAQALTARAVGVVSGASLLSLLHPAAKGCGDAYFGKVADANGRVRKRCMFNFVTNEVPGMGASPTTLEIRLPHRLRPYLLVMLGLQANPALAYAAFFYEFGGGVGYAHVPLS